MFRAAIRRFLTRLAALLVSHEGAVSVQLTATIPGGATMAITITDVQQVKLTATFLDTDRNPTAISNPVWAVVPSAAETVVTLTPAPDGLTCVAAATGKIGSDDVTVTGTNGAGVPVSSTVTITVGSSDATTAEITADAPEALAPVAAQPVAPQPEAPAAPEAAPAE